MDKQTFHIQNSEYAGGRHKLPWSVLPFSVILYCLSTNIFNTEYSINIHKYNLNDMGAPKCGQYIMISSR